jgi:hypothetical protein
VTWFQTYSRVAFDLAAPRADQVRAADLAHASALINRFNGHTRVAWPLAQHAVMVAAAAWYKTRDRITAAIGLLHDGAEPYVGDISAPMKTMLAVRAPGVLREIEANVLDAVCIWAGIPTRPRGNVQAASTTLRAWDLVRDLDYRALFHDRDWILGEPVMPWVGEGEVVPLGPADVGAVAGDDIWNPLTSPWSAPVAESAFTYALNVLVPLSERDRRETMSAAHGSASYPPSWLVPALRRVLPRALES